MLKILSKTNKNSTPPFFVVLRDSIPQSIIRKTVSTTGRRERNDDDDDDDDDPKEEKKDVFYRHRGVPRDEFSRVLVVVAVFGGGEAHLCGGKTSGFCGASSSSSSSFSSRAKATDNAS